MKIKNEISDLKMTTAEVEQLKKENLNLQLQLEECREKLTARTVNLVKTEILLSDTESKLSKVETKLRETESDLAQKTKNCSDLNKRVQEEVNKRHAMRNNRYKKIKILCLF